MFAQLIGIAAGFVVGREARSARRCRPSSPARGARVALGLVLALLGMVLLGAPQALAGAMQLDGQFKVNAQGAATYTIPLTVPPGTAGMQPSLTLDYNSQGANGLLGVGWTLGGFMSIGRCPQTPVQDGAATSIAYASSDRFCLDDQRLMLVSGTYGGDGAEYRTEVESFTRVISHGVAGTGPSWFEIRTKSGQTMQLGNSTDSKILALGQTSVRMWALNRITDTKGNYLTVTYTNSTTTGEYYPTRIDYTGNAAAGVTPYASVRFVYTARPSTDPVIGYLGGSMVQITQLLTDIQTYVGSTPVLDYALTYSAGSYGLQSQRSVLSQIQLCTGNTRASCTQRTTFGWADGTRSNYGTFSQIIADNAAKNAIYGDVNGDGMVDVVSQDSTNVWSLRLGSDSGWLSTVNTGISDKKAQLGDMYASGRADLITLNGSNQIKIYPSTGSGFGTGTVAATPSGIKGFSLTDVNHDGRPDLIYWTSSHLYYAIWNGSTFGTGQVIQLSTSNNILALSAFPANISGHGYTDLVVSYVTDESHDPNHVDYVIWNGSGFNASTSLGQSNGTPYPYAADINGDGLTDLYLVNTGGSKQIYISNGNTLGTPVTAPFGNSDCPKGMVFADLYRSGRTDLICQTSATTLSVATSTGTSYGALSALATLPSNASNGTLVALDFLGRGVTDLAYLNGNNGMLQAYSPMMGNADLLSSFALQLGSATSINYGSLVGWNPPYTKGTSGSYPVINIQPATYVVSSTTVLNNGGNKKYVLNYKYSGAQVEVDGRGFLGFATLTETESLTGLVSTTSYRQDFPYIGMVASEVKKSGSTTLSQVTNSYSKLSFAGTRAFPYLSQRVSQAWDLDGSAMPTVTTNNQVDSYGNNTRLSVSSSDGSSKVTVSTYSNDTVNWYLGRLTQAQVTSTPAGGGTALTRTSSFAYDAGTGLLTQEVVEPNDSALRLQTDYGYDAFGNRTTATVSGSGISARTSSTAYDSQGRFPVTVTNALGQTASQTFEPNFGGVASVTDANGLVTQTQYDSLGRKVLVIAPDGTRVTTAYRQPPGSQMYTVTMTPLATDGTTQIGATKVAYFDQFERQYRTYTQAIDGRGIYQDTTYDSLGRVSTTSRPYFSTPQNATFTYDILGRVLTETGPDGSVVQHAYHGLTQVHTNPLGQTRTVLQNGQGKTVRVTDALGNATNFTYDAFENLLTTTDPAGHVVSATYDLRGRKIAMRDPDLGSWSYGYDVLGELVSQTDAKGQTVTLGYDLLGRLVSKIEPDMTSSWVYDTQPHGIGKLASAANLSGFQRSFVYDALSRPVQTNVTIAGVGYTVTTSYDAYSRISGVTYASGVSVSYGYTATTGYLQSVTDSASGTALWTVNGQDAEGHVTQETLGNGIATTYGYDAQTGRLLQIQAGVGNAVQNWSFTWDRVGNLTQRVDYANGVTEGFGYDGLNRLTQVTTSDPGQSINLSKTASYDALGNITARSELGSYSYDPAHVHAVSAISGTMNASYGYDADGNMVSGGGRTIAWTSYNMVQQVTMGASSIAYTYDTEHGRISETDADGSSKYYVNDPTSGAMSERVLSTTSPVMWNDYIMAGGQMVAVRVTGTSGATTKYFHKDHLGSIAAVTDPSGTVIERDSYDAWGKRRYASGLDALWSVTLASDLSRGFTGQENMDSVGLINFNGRVYDPTIGRFLSADPFIQAPEDGQSYNRYSYIGNNPLSGTDPSGYFSIGGIFRSIVHAIVSAAKWLWRSTIGRMLLAIAAAAFGQWYLLEMGVAPLIAATVGGAIGGAVATGTLKGAIIGAVTAAAFFEVGEWTAVPASSSLFSPETIGKNIANVLGHAVIGCLQGIASGGKCGPQALAGAVGAASGLVAARVEFGDADVDFVARGAVSTVGGGVAAVAGGGKFVNGAETAAFGYLFNQGLHDLSNPPSRVEGSVSLLGDIAGKIWNIPNDLIGLGVGIFDMGASILTTGELPGLRFGADALQIYGLHIGPAGGITFGNVQLYTDVSPDYVMPSSPYTNLSGFEIQYHEEFHSVQSEVYGPLFLPAYFFNGGFFNPRNPFEVSADVCAATQTCRVPSPW
jgi:RHS repeat-associated protein